MFLAQKIVSEYDQEIPQVQTADKYVPKKGIIWKQRLHQRTETRVCIFPGPD